MFLRILIVDLKELVNNKSSFITFNIIIYVVFNSKDLLVNNLINVLKKLFFLLSFIIN